MEGGPVTDSHKCTIYTRKLAYILSQQGQFIHRTDFLPLAKVVSSITSK